MNSYMSSPFGISPAALGQNSTAASVAVSAAIPAATGVGVISPVLSTALVGFDPAGYSYVGCFEEIPGGLLSDADEQSAWNTPLACSQFCRGSQFFGVESGADCYCGKAIDPEAQWVDRGCNIPCPGDRRYACGGDGLLSIYQKGTWTS